MLITFKKFDIKLRGSDISQAGEGTALQVWADAWFPEAPRFRKELNLESNASGAEIIAAAYRQWSLAELGKLRASLSAVIYDASEQKLFLLRDYMAERGLFLYQGKDQITIGSSPAEVAQRAGLPLDENPVAVASYFALQSPPAHQTWIAGVEEVWPGEVWQITKSGLKQSMLSHRPGLQELRLSSAEEYIEQWRSVMASAVADAISGHQHAAIALSGGLDSTLIAASVAPNALQHVTAISWELRAYPDSNETAFIEQTCAALGIKRIGFDGSQLGPLSQFEDWPISLDSPMSNPYRRLRSEIYEHAVANGCTALLSGNFGDHIYPSSAHWLFDALKFGHFRIIAKQLAFYARDSGVKGLYREPGLRHLFSRLRGKSARSWEAAWLTPASRELLQGAESSSLSGLGQHRHMDQLQGLIGSAASHDAALELHFSEKYPIALRHPYRDWRVVDFMLSAPAWLGSHLGQTKWLTREVLRSKIPDNVRNRAKSGSLQPYFSQAVRQENRHIADLIISGPQANWPCFAEQSKVSSAWAQNHGDDTSDLLIWICISYELWRRARTGI